MEKRWGSIVDCKWCISIVSLDLFFKEKRPQIEHDVGYDVIKLASNLNHGNACTAYFRWRHVRRRCESNRDRKRDKESIGASSPSSRARQRTTILPATFGGDGLKTENEKEQGNSSGSFFTSTWSSATGRGQLARTSSVATAAALQARRHPKRATELARQGSNV